MDRIIEALTTGIYHKLTKTVKEGKVSSNQVVRVISHGLYYIGILLYVILLIALIVVSALLVNKQSWLEAVFTILLCLLLTYPFTSKHK